MPRLKKQNSSEAPPVTSSLPSSPPALLLPQEVEAELRQLLEEVRAKLYAQYTASWITLRTNPELVRAKAQVLDDVCNAIRGHLNAGN